MENKKPSEQCPSQVNIVINGNFLPGIINGLLTNPTTVPTILTPHHMTTPQQPPIKRVKLTPEQREKVKQERERIKLERERQREETKTKKEAEKKAKMEERERQKKERIEKKEKEEKEKQEKLAAKQAEQQRKIKEKEEAKKMKEREKEMKDELAAVEKLKAKERFMGYFNKPKTTTLTMPKECNDNVTRNNSNTIMDQARLTLFEELVRTQNVVSDYLKMCKQVSTQIKHLPKYGKKDSTVAMDMVTMDMVAMDTSNDVEIISDGSVCKRKFKLLQFHDNHRPAYYGTWRKMSSILTPRNPLKMDKDIFDYECDSDLEWEEEEPGESLSASEGEEGVIGEESGEEEEEDGFFVPHGYLSEGEGDQSDEDNDQRQRKHLAKAKAWEAEFSRQCRRLVPIKVGVVWTPSSLSEKSKSLLLQFSAVSIVATPIKIEPHPSSSTPSHVNFPEEALSDLARLVHCSHNGIKKLVETFQNHWMNKTGQSLSKKQITRKIVSMATKETRPPSSKPQWYVQDDILSCIDGCGQPLSPIVTPSAKKGIKRCHGNVTTPTMKSIKDFFTPPLRSTENVTRRLYDKNNEPKKLKLATPTPDDVILVEDTLIGNKENSCHGNDKVTPTTDEVILVEDTLMDSENNDIHDQTENNMEIQQETNYEAMNNNDPINCHGNLESINCHGNNEPPSPNKKDETSIDWSQCMSSSVHMTVPVDHHF